MRKIVMFNRVSLDGFFAGANGEIDWHVMDEGVDRALHEMMSPDTILFGRVTYQLFESFWPHVLKDPDAPEGLRQLATELNEMTKVVFSTTLPDVTWVNSTLHRGNVVEEARRLKQGDGADIVIFGSGTIVQQLADEGLIDEYFVTVTPVVLGAGKPLFNGVSRATMKHCETRTFDSGNILLHYAAR